MARLNIEDTLWTDLRFQDLLVKSGNRWIAKGMILELWCVAQKYWLASRGRGIPKPAWIDLGLSNDLIECRLARDDGEFVYAIGSREQFAWLEQASRAGHNGGVSSGIARRENKGKSAKVPGSGTKRGEASSSFSFSFSKKEEINTSKPANQKTEIPQEVWTEYEATFEHYGREPNRARDEVPIMRAYLGPAKRDWWRVQRAIAGYRFEKKSGDYDPAGHCSLTRLEDRVKFDRLEALGETRPAETPSKRPNPNPPTWTSPPTLRGPGQIL